MPHGAPRPGSGPGLSRNSPVVSAWLHGHHRAPDVRWNCVNSQLYRQLQRLSHPGPPSRVTICIGSDHPGHQLAIVPDITTHMVTISVWEHQEKQIERRRYLFIFMLKIKESLKDTKSHNNEKMNLFNSRGGRGKDAFKYLCFTFYWSLSSFADIHLDLSLLDARTINVQWEQ